MGFEFRLLAGDCHSKVGNEMKATDEITINYEGRLIGIKRYVDDARDFDGYVLGVENGPPIYTETRPRNLVVGEHYRIILTTTSASFERTIPMNDKIEACARAAHEANRAYCLALGDTSQPPWEDAPEWQQLSAKSGVRGVLHGNTPEQSHEGWLAEKEAAGWKFGPVKDPEKKEHPCFVQYNQLPPEQRQKDHIFVAVVTAMAEALDLHP